MNCTWTKKKKIKSLDTSIKKILLRFSNEIDSVNSLINKKDFDTKDLRVTSLDLFLAHICYKYA
jgi:hypothetical protein